MLAWHVIATTYGFWLPNDPRGSGSAYVGRIELLEFGRATKIDARRSVASVPHDAAWRLKAKQSLKYPPVRLTGAQARAVGRGFGLACREGRYVIHACSILPEHVHLVIARHERPIGRIVGHLRGRATQRLAAEGLWPDARPVWGRKPWNVFLDTPANVLRAIAYVEANPLKEGKPAQRWRFVTPYKAS